MADEDDADAPPASGPVPDLDALRAENAALRRALHMLADVANLARAAEDPEATAYAILTGVTAGVGLGMHRAMMFERVPGPGRLLVGRAAIGPESAAEADRVWRSIEASQPDLETLYEAGMRMSERGARGRLDAIVRQMRVDLDAHPRSPLALGAEGLVCAVGEDDLDGLLHPPTAIAAPMRGREGLRGVLVADNRFGGGVPDDASRLVFSMVADHAGRALFAADRWAEVARDARVDALTGLDARRVGMALLEHAASVAIANGRGVSLCLLDVDRFKSVNDEHGHPVGDLVLKEVGARVRASLRGGERAFRYGGEEIGVLLRARSASEARARAAAVRGSVGERPIAIDGAHSLHVTCSAGLAAAVQGLDAAGILRAADDALLRAKRLGRDRLETA